MRKMKSRPNGPKFCRDPLWGLKPWPTKFESHCFKTVALRQSQSFSSCPLLLVGLSQNSDRASRIVATEIFFLKWLRSCSNFVRGFSLMKLGEKLHITMGLRCSILWSEPSQKLNLVHFCWWDLVKIWRRHPELLQWKFFFSNVSDLAGT